MFYDKIMIYSSAVATFHVPSNISGISGMRHKWIHVVKSWQNGLGCYDTIFVNTDLSMEGMQSLDVARIQLLFLFSHEGIEYSCVLVHWFSCVGNSPDDHTGMWVVQTNNDECPPISKYDPQFPQVSQPRKPPKTS